MKSKTFLNNNFDRGFLLAVLLSTVPTVVGAEIVAKAENLEPAIAHQSQQKEAQDKLKTFEKNSKKKPNILIFLVDDMGWGDPGAYGGGVAVGAATPNIDRLARQGLKLTSAYSQPLCTPTRATMLTGWSIEATANR